MPFKLNLRISLWALLAIALIALILPYVLKGLRKMGSTED